MDKLIQLGVEARIHDSKIAQIESRAYSGEITSDQAIDLVEQELVRYNLAWSKVMRSVSEEQFMKEQHLLALPN